MPNVKIKSIKAGMENLHLTANVVHVGDKRIVETRYGSADIAVAIIEDESGRIDLKLWRNQIAKAKVGKMVRIEDAFASMFDGKLELNVGSRGRIEIL